MSTIFSKDATAFLYRYLNNASPTSFEMEGQKIWLDYIKPYIDDHIVDSYGSVAGVINPGKDYSVAIEAHADEIAWYVRYISEEGFIYVIRNGGSDHMIAPSMRVNIHTKDGIRKGVFGWPAIHTRRASGKDEPVPKVENIFIDVGASSKDEVEEMGIHVGCVITFDDELMELNDRYFVGRALDNRAGGFMIAQVARMLYEQKNTLPFTLYIVNSVQEEIGLRGAEMMAYRLKPDAAIITDVCHDTNTPLIDKKVEGDFKGGDGPVITYGPAVQNKLRELIITTAQQQKIPFQREAASRSTGTDTDAFAYTRGGIPSALISLPLRYMHTTVEMVHKADMEHVVNLMYQSLLNIEERHNFNYF